MEAINSRGQPSSMLRSKNIKAYVIVSVHSLSLIIFNLCVCVFCVLNIRRLSHQTDELIFEFKIETREPEESVATFTSKALFDMSTPLRRPFLQLNAFVNGSPPGAQPVLWVSSISTVHRSTGLTSQID